MYVQDDLYSTMVMNEKSGNTEANKSEVMNQISDVIANEKAEVIDALNSSGIPTKADASDKEVIGKIVDNLPSNNMLQAGISYIIAVKNKLISTADTAIGGDVLKTTERSVVNVGKSVIEGLRNILASTSRIGSKEADKKELSSKVASKKNGESTESKSMGNGGMLIALVGLGILGLYLINRRN